MISKLLVILGLAYVISGAGFLQSCEVDSDCRDGGNKKVVSVVKGMKGGMDKMCCGTNALDLSSGVKVCIPRMIEGFEVDGQTIECTTASEKNYDCTSNDQCTTMLEEY